MSRLNMGHISLLVPLRNTLDRSFAIPMHQRLLALSLLLLTATSLVAQGPPRGAGGGRAGFRIPDPVLFNGPPPPEEFLDLVGLDSTQYTAYREQYVAFMDQTR